MSEEKTKSNDMHVKSAYDNRNANHKRKSYGNGSFTKSKKYKPIPRGHVGSRNARQVVNFLKRHLYELHIKKGNDVLDLCCGVGGDLDKFAHLNVSSIIGVDISAESIREANSRSTSGLIHKMKIPVSLHESDLRSNILRFQPLSDIVTCSLALHYFWGDATHIDNVLTTVQSSLKKQGYFLLVILDEAQIPKEGIKSHPYMHISPLYEENKRQAYVRTKKQMFLG
jgi:ubiquinone/menaquinone biosynthesis C-methylase UbiE